MARVYLFADEAGNFDFSRKNGASRYFIVGTVTMKDTQCGHDLLELRRELAWQAVGLESSFHATEDKQVVRDEVFRLLAATDFRADFTIIEKRKTQPHRQSMEGLYKLAWYMHMKHVGPRVIGSRDEILVIAATIGTKTRRRAIRFGIEDVIGQVTTRPWEVAFWPAESDPCLQVADYVTWAVQRKWERGDERSNEIVEPKIITEYDIFKWGSTYYY
jgi:hypothetical protein